MLVYGEALSKNVGQKALSYRSHSKKEDWRIYKQDFHMYVFSAEVYRNGLSVIYGARLSLFWAMCLLPQAKEWQFDYIYDSHSVWAMPTDQGTHVVWKKFV